MLGVSDLLLPYFVQPADFGAYQYVRQLAPLLVIFSLFGIDQVISREYPGHHADTVNWSAAPRHMLPAAAVLGAAAAILSVRYAALPVLSAVPLAILPSVLLYSELAAGYLRARGDYARASLTQQGYRLALGATLLVTLPIAGSLSSFYSVLLLVTTVPFATVGRSILRNRLLRSQALGKGTFRDLRHVGGVFALTILTLGALDWVDQAAVNWRTESFASAGVYVASKVYLVFPFIVLGSILGFSALPEVAKRPTGMTVSTFLRTQRTTAVLGVTVGSVLLLGTVSFSSLLPFGIPALASILFLCSGIMRLMYLVPSAVLGALATRAILSHFAVATILCLFVEAATILLLPESVNPVVAGSAGLLVASTSRFLAGIYYSLLSIRCAARRESQ